MGKSKQHLEARERLELLEREVRTLRSTLEDYRSMLDKYRTLADCSLAGIYVVRDGRLQYVNPRFTEMLGYEREEDLVGQDFKKIVHPLDRQAFPAGPGAEDSFPARRRFRALKKDGAAVRLDLRGTHARYLGKLANIGTVVDVTEQEEAEEALRQSEEKYRTIIDHIEDGYYEVDIRGNLAFFNDSFARILGYERRELFGLNYGEYAAPEQALLISRTFNQVYSSGQPRRSIAWEVLDKDGEARHLEVSVSLIRDRAGHRTGFRGIARDVTERKIVEQELRRHRDHLEELVQERTAELTRANQALSLQVAERRRAEQKLIRERNLSESLVRSLPGVFYVYGPDGFLKRWNENLAVLTGYDEAELDGKALLDFFLEDDRERVSGIVADVFTHGRNLMEADVVAKDGRVTPYYFSAVGAVLDGQPSLVGVGIDISARKNFENALIRSEKELKALSGRLITAQEEERRRVARELHDGVGQALTAAKVGLEGAIKRFSREGRRDHLEILGALVPTFQRAIDEVRRMSMDLRPSMIDDLGVISTLKWFSREFRRFYPDIDLGTDIGISEEEVPDSLKIVIYRIIQEALHNAAKHSQAREVLIRLEKKDSRLELTIRDDGVGFDLEQIRDADPDRRGVGLTSMRERAEFSGGEFSLAASPGRGVQVQAAWRLGS
ncbi:MAG: PAS domain S-box protein [Pseudomonadota bacterium]